MDANRLEAQRCMDIVRASLKKGDGAKAAKFLDKAVRLDPNTESKFLREKIAKAMSGAGEAEDEAAGGSRCTTDEAGYGHYDQYDENVSEVRSRKQRFHASRSQPTMRSEEEERGMPDGSEEPSRHRPTSSSFAAGSRLANGTAARSRTRSASKPQLGVDYTQEQHDAVQKIRSSKDYYEILCVTKDVNDDGLKKSYRKAALLIHPDKCKVPGTTEAFKALGNAYQVLSNPEKRQKYDLYGAETQTSRRHNHGDFYEYDFNRGFEAEVSPEDIFNMFFGGGYPSGSVNRRRAHFHYYHREEPQGGEQQGSFAPLLQLLPLLAILFLGLLAQLMVGDPAFSLSANQKYSVQRYTKELQIPYYVKPDFVDNYRNKVKQIENQVEDEYVSQLRMNCYREKNQRETMLWRARTFGDNDLWQRAQKLTTPSCTRLNEIYGN